jgi:hypothetical protein
MRLIARVFWGGGPGWPWAQLAIPAPDMGSGQRVRQELNNAGTRFCGEAREHPEQSLRSGRASSDRRALQLGREADRLVAKIIGWVVVILIVIWIISDPTAAGTSVHNWITDIVSFFTHLARG